jgi:putative membrane protein
MQQPININTPQKQSPIVVLIALLQGLKQMWPIFLMAFAKYFFDEKKDTTKDSDSQWIVYTFLGGFLIILLFKLGEILQYFTVWFYTENNELVVKKGLFVKTKVSIPIQNIQTIQTTQQALHRLSNTFKLTIDSPGTNKEEVSLLAVKETVYKALLQIVEEYENNFDTIKKIQETEADNITHTLSIIDIVKLGISENHLRTLTIIVFFIGGKLQDIQQYFGIDSFGYINKQQQVLQGIKAISIISVFFLALTIIVSFVMIAIKYFNMQLQFKPNGLLVKWGLINTNEKFIGSLKTQTLVYKANFVRKLLGLFTVRLYATDENEAKQNTHIQLAISNAETLKQLLLFYVPNYTNHCSNIMVPHKKMVFREILLYGVPFFLIAFTITFYFYSWLSLLWIIWLTYHLVARNINQKKYKAFVHPHYLHISKGIWGIENIVLHYDNIQHVCVTTSPYKRVNNLANLKIYTAGKNITIPFLQIQQANELANYLIAYTEGYKFETEVKKSKENEVEH